MVNKTKTIMKIDIKDYNDMKRGRDYYMNEYNKLMDKKVISKTEYKYPYKWNVNDSVKMILIDIEIFEEGAHTPYELVERIKEELDKINNIIK